MHQRNWRTVFDSAKPFKVLESILELIFCVACCWCLYCYPTFENFILLSVTRRLRVVYIHYNNKMQFSSLKMSPHFSSFHQVSRIPYIFCLPVAWKQKCEILDSWNIKLLCWSQNFNICWQSEGRPAAAAAGSKQCAVTGGWQHRGVEGCRYRDMGVYCTYSELQNISPFGYNMFVVFFNRYIIMFIHIHRHIEHLHGLRVAAVLKDR